MGVCPSSAESCAEDTGRRARVMPSSTVSLTADLSASLPLMCLRCSAWGYPLLLGLQNSLTPGLGHCANIP